jgi:SRSO17 transposase
VKPFDHPDGIVVIDDTGFAKKGRYSVGVARQYSGTLGMGTAHGRDARSSHQRNRPTGEL